jgi:F420H(2)-dependent quinone reductase
MPEGHTPFAILNRSGNHAIAAVLRSPLHGLASGRLALITVTGRRSGKQHTFPVGYDQDGEVVTIHIQWANRKLWWRNLREAAPVRIRIRGEERSGRGVLVRDEGSTATVEVTLDPRPAST